MIIVDTGIPKSIADPRDENSGKPKLPVFIDCSDMTYVRPRINVIIARVTTNGASLNRATMNPLISPQNAPLEMPIKNDNQTGSPQCTVAVAARIAEKPTTDPTERSIPPVKITKSIPNDNNPGIVGICRIILVRLFEVKNTPLVNGLAMIASAITTKERIRGIVTSLPLAINLPRRIATPLMGRVVISSGFFSFIMR